MNAHDLRRAQWRTSTHSANGSTCVQVACNLLGIVAVRDSKDPAGPALCSPRTNGGPSQPSLQHGCPGPA